MLQRRAVRRQGPSVRSCVEQYLHIITNEKSLQHQNYENVKQKMGSFGSH
jgi:hypothetical protein